MPFYENVFIARQELGETQVKELAGYFSKIITDNGGTIHKTEFWGLRNFAYRINKSRRGHYILIEMDAPAAALHEMERQMRLHEDVVRYLSMREEALSEGPSVVMDKTARDEDVKREPRKFNKEVA